HPFAVAAGDLGHGRLARRLLGPPIDQRVPERRAADREADEPRHAGRARQPVAYLLVVLATAPDDAADPVAPAPPRRRPPLRAVLAPVQPFDLPHIRFDARVLELVDRLHHQ